MRRVGTKQQADAVRSAPRRAAGIARTRSNWLRTGAGVMVTCASLLFVTTTVGSVWMVRVGIFSTVVEQLKITAVDLTVKAGLTVHDVLVVGRRKTKRSDLLSAIDVQRGDPILVFDPSAARRRVVSLGWIADAEVERRLPNTIYVRLFERTPIAIWQRNGIFSLVDAEGVVIAEGRDEHRRKLPLIVGAKAPSHASTLIVMLRTQPQLMEQMVAAVRVADRRWNLRFANKIDVRLPEENPQAAWDRLAELEAEHKLLERDIIAIDLRIPERLVVRMRPAAARRLRSPGEHT
jgi:cell division protein FtsQ